MKQITFVRFFLTESRVLVD